VRGREIMPRTAIRHGFGDPLKPLVVPLAARTNDLSQSRSHAAIGKTTHTMTLPGSAARRFTEQATRKEHVILFADCGSRVMPDEPGPNVWG
jgi:hypothetical protein